MNKGTVVTLSHNIILFCLDTHMVPHYLLLNTIFKLCVLSYNMLNIIIFISYTLCYIYTFMYIKVLNIQV